MADAKFTRYSDIGGGSVVIPDNNATALDIESTDGKDYILIDTTDSHETINIGSGATSSDVCHVSIGSSPGSIGEILRVRQNHTSDSLVLFENTGSGIALDVQVNSSSGDALTVKNNSGGVFASFNADHALKLTNPTHEDTDGGRESTIRFSGEKADGTAHELVRLESHHDGSEDDTKGEFSISTNNGTSLTERVTINSSGFFGINDSSPSKRLTLKAGSSNEDIFVILSSSGGTCIRDEIYGSDGATRYFKSGSANHIIGAGTTFAGCVFNELGESGVDFRIESDSNTHMFFLDSSENKIGINVASPAHPLDVAGTAGLSTGTAWTNTSDERIKTDIQNIENGLEAINSLRPVSFKYSEDYLRVHPEIDGSKRYNSFIAQEYAQVFPDAVSSSGDLVEVLVEGVRAAPENGIEAVEEQTQVLLEDVKQFTPHDLNMYLVRAVQELSARLAALESGE